MKLILIKLGKALKTIQREGLFRGGRRVLKSFGALFGRVGEGDILFVTGGVGDSARYRCHHVAEELGLHGFKCSVTVQDNPFLASYVKKFRIFVFHRTLFTGAVVKLIEKIKERNKEIIFETDDLVYDPKYLEHMDYFKQLNKFEKKLYENGVGGEILNDPYVEVCTTTTSYLAEKLKEKPARNASHSDTGGGKKVFIVPNKLSDKDLEVADRIIGSKVHQVHKVESIVRVGYFSGTISHNKDFATITEALMQIMEKYSQVRLVLAGPLDIENRLNKFKDRIEQIPFASREKHFENISKVDINLAPLEMGNPFCEAKSELKFFEAGIVGVPTVAVANQTFTQAIFEGMDGFLAGTTEEWVEKLSKLIEDEDLRRKVGERARVKALQKYSNKNSANEEYYKYLRDKLI